MITFKSYTDSKKIAALFNSLIPGVEIELSDGLVTQRVKPKKYKILDDKLMALYIEQPGRRMTRILFSVVLVEKHKDKIVFTTDQLDESVLNKHRNMNDSVIKGKNRGFILLDFGELSNG